MTTVESAFDSREVLAPLDIISDTLQLYGDLRTTPNLRFVACTKILYLFHVIQLYETRKLSSHEELSTNIKKEYLNYTKNM
jgi:hypothetical protein